MISLEPTTEADFDSLIRWADSPAFVLQWTAGTFSYPLDESQLRNHLDAPRTERRAFTATGEDGEPVGYLELNNIDRERDSASIARVVVAPDRRNEGIGTEMVREATRIGFEEEDLHRIALRVFDFNDAAVACYESVGFRREGILRDAVRHDDEYWSLVVMSILEDEWAAQAD